MRGFTPAPIAIKNSASKQLVPRFTPAPIGINQSYNQLVRGFTLIEILVTVLILSFIVAGIFAVLNVTDTNWHSDTGLLDLQQQARQCMFTMVKELRQGRAADIIISGPNNEVSFYLPPPVYGEPWEGPVRYYLDVNDANSDGVTDEVIREYPQGTRRVLAKDITLLNFSLNADVVEIRAAAEESVRGRQLCFPSPCQNPRRLLKEIVRLRNE